MTIRSMPPNKNYRDNWDRIFGKAKCEDCEDCDCGDDGGKLERFMERLEDLTNHVIERCGVPTDAEIDELIDLADGDD